MSKIIIGGTFNLEISEEVDKIYAHVKLHTNCEIDFEYTEEETSYCQKNDNRYVIFLRKDAENINDVLAHELLHILQSEDGMTISEIPEDISEENLDLIASLKNIILDYDVNQELINTYKYDVTPDHTQFNAWFPLIKQKKNPNIEISQYDTKSFAVNFFGVMVLDSKNNCEKLLRYADQYTLEIRKIVYHLNDCIKLYDVGNRVDSCKTIYEECAKVLGIL